MVYSGLRPNASADLINRECFGMRRPNRRRRRRYLLNGSTTEAAVERARYDTLPVWPRGWQTTPLCRADRADHGSRSMWVAQG